MVGLITIFGGGGFLGRYVTQALLSQGVRVRIAERDPRKATFLKPQGGLGQSQFIAADITRPETIARALADADGAINLVGILKGDFQAVHVAGARAIAQAAAAAKLATLVHISAIGADSESASAYARSKGDGEATVREAFPQATILRPSILFGPEDKFVNRFAALARMLPALPVIRPDVRFQPAYVADVAQAIATAALAPGAHGGNTYELGGPQILSMLALIQQICTETGRTPALVPLPDFVAGLAARLTGWLPGAPITRDQWLMLQRDNIVSPGAQTFEALGITPVPLAAVAPGWLVQYRRHGRFGAIGKTA